MHVIIPGKATLHGYFSRDLSPILTIKSGEMVRYSTLDASWRYIEPTTGEMEKSEHEQSDPLKGHALCGPIAIDGAKKGMTLEIQIGDIQVETMGWNLGGGYEWDYFERLGVAEEPEHLVFWKLDAETGTATNDNGHIVKLAPFMGVLGMPPDEDGQHPTSPPRITGGNIDCKALTSGSRLFLPIAVDSGLFSVGDGHAAQGDGEVSGTAIECPMKQVDLTFVLHPDLKLTTPRARVPEGWITFGFHEDLDEAAIIALNAMLDWIMEQYQVSRKVALSLASVVVDLRVTQVVNGVKGIHAVLPEGAIS